MTSLERIPPYTPYNEFKENQPVIDEHDQIISTIDKLIDSLKAKQKYIARKLDSHNKKKYSFQTIRKFFKDSQ